MSGRTESSLKYQRRMMADPGPAGEAFRAKRREIDRKRREKRKNDPERIRAMAEKIAKDTERKRQKVQPSVSKRVAPFVEPRKPSVIEVTPAKPVRMTSDEWIAQGGKVEVLPSKLGDRFGGLSELRIALF